MEAEGFGVGTGGGDVLAGDDPLTGTFGHPGEGRAAEVVEDPFLAEGVVG